MNKALNCEKCIPFLMPGNMDVFRVYSEVKGQWIMANSGPIAINVLAIDSVMDELEIPKELRRETKQRVQQLGQVMFKRMQEDNTDGG